MFCLFTKIKCAFLGGIKQAGEGLGEGVVLLSIVFVSKCNRCFSGNAPCADSFYSHQHFSAVERVSIARRIKGKSPLRASNKEPIHR